MEAIKAEGSYAWIMWSGYNATYSVGDKYDASSATGGVIASDVKVTGAGTYTVSLDFTGCTNGHDTGFSFSALGLSNGEILYPGYVIDIKEIKDHKIEKALVVLKELEEDEENGSSEN
jgi:endoglucanase